MRRCCPDSCNTGTFTEDQCNNFSGSGTCVYPNDAQCETRGSNTTDATATSKLASSTKMTTTTTQTSTKTETSIISTQSTRASSITVSSATTTEMAESTAVATSITSTTTVSKETVTCGGNIDTSYDCSECFDGTKQKYLWGSKCKARKYFSSTMLDGRCGMEYACVTSDIRECPYNQYCPESPQGRLKPLLPDSLELFSIV